MKLRHFRIRKDLIKNNNSASKVYEKLVKLLNMKEKIRFRREFYCLDNFVNFNLASPLSFFRRFSWPNYYRNVHPQHDAAFSRTLKKATFIIIDLQRVINNKTPFGGKVLLLGGDFRQRFRDDAKPTLLAFKVLNYRRTCDQKIRTILTRNLTDDNFNITEFLERTNIINAIYGWTVDENDLQGLSLNNKTVN